MWTSGNGLLKRPLQLYFVTDVKMRPLQKLNVSVTGPLSQFCPLCIPVGGYFSLQVWYNVGGDNKNKLFTRTLHSLVYFP